jgi:hypothetical protein
MVVKHVIVDGSNIATEGREAPSLAQLDEAVRAFVEEYGPDIVTVVVDATFPNRIDPSERQTYEDAVVANELITPPAGAIGRGDGFVLQIADKAGASILSNDSFQEFHGRYPWLFERGRLIGGKPVPHVGWVFMERAPVRGPTSRRAVSEARKEAKAAASASASAPASADKPAARKSTARKSRAKAAAASEPAASASESSDLPVASPPSSDGASGVTDTTPAPAAAESYNEALTFIEFVAAHPVGSEVEATVERFSSHGAYAVVGEAKGYLPLRYLGDPAPRSAKEVLTVGETRSFVVVAIDPPRRGIDLGLPGVAHLSAPAAPAEPAEHEPPPRKRASRKQAAEPALEAPARKRASRKKPEDQPPEESPEAPPRKRTSRKKAAEPAPEAAEPPPPRKRASRKKAAEPALAEPTAGAALEAAEPAPARKRASRKKAAEPVPAPAAEEPAPRKRAARKKAADPVLDESPTDDVAHASRTEDGGEPRKRASRKKAAPPAEGAPDLNGGPPPEPAAPRKRAARKKAAEPTSPAPAPPEPATATAGEAGGAS